MRAFTRVAAMATYAAAADTETKGDDVVLADVAADAAPAGLPDILLDEATPAGKIEAGPIDGSGDVEGAIAQAEHNEAIVAQIDDALTVGPKDDGEEVGAYEQLPVPDNYRPPPKQDVKPRARRDRPNIHDHGLLKSMDLDFVSSSFDAPANRRSTGPIGFLSQGGSG